MSTRAVVTVIALGIGLSAWFMYAWWQRRALGDEARSLALPACTEKLGEDACREHLATFHDDCGIV